MLFRSLAFLLLGLRRPWCALGAAGPALLYLGARAWLLSEATLSPKIGFMWGLGPLGARQPLEAGAALAGALGRALLLGFEALGPFPWLLSLAGLGVLLRGKPTRPPGAGALLAALLLAWLGMALFQVKRRFLVDWSPLLLAPGALAWAAVPGRARRPLGLLLLLVLAGDLWRLAPPRKADREAEAALGRWLSGRLGPGETIATDMPRVAYYAGRTPPPPRVLEVEELAAACAAPGTLYLVLGTRRELLEAFGPPPPWRPLPLPEELARGDRKSVG